MKPEDVHNYNDLMRLNVPRLRDLVHEKTEVTNALEMDKRQLCDTLADAFGFEKPHHEHIAGIERLKVTMKVAKKQRDEILGQAPAARDKAQLDKVRHQMRRLKRQMRKLAHSVPRARPAAS